MQLKDIVCDLEYAEKLKVLGLKKESLFYFPAFGELCKNDCDYLISASQSTRTYTVAELFEILPNEIGWDVLRNTYSHKFNWCYKYVYDDGKSSNNKGCGTKDDKQANSLAKLLIWLIENNNVNVEDLNNA
jgi:hypothetical protein